jgi:ribosomal 50S subunit-recycling heat shock protein
LIRTYSNSVDVISEIQDRWKETIVYGVDATKVENSFTEDRFDIVIFNHPHLGGATLLESEEKHAKRHHVLLAHYFHSAKKILKQDGVVHVCLCGKQPQTWDVASAAEKNGLRCVLEKSTECPISSWLFRDGFEYSVTDVESHYPAKRKFRNGKLGSKHFLSRYGYMHRRTAGELFQGNIKEVNVQQSRNYVFAEAQIERPADTSDIGATGQKKCFVCQTVFKCQDELESHIKNPAPLDAYTDSTELAMAKSQNEMSERHTAQKVPTNEQVSNQHIDIEDATILIEATVTQEFDSTRIKWLCRQPSFALSRHIKSKKQCEDAIKAGRVFVNRTVAMDTGRIVHKNDTVTLIEKFEPATVGANTSDELQSGVKIIKQLVPDQNGIPSLVVLYKPVGVRCVGQFASDTLEMITQSYYERRFGSANTHCQSLSKIDTGCAGLCALKIGDSKSSNSCPSKIMYTFTALVHGSPAEDWKTGVYVSVPTNGCRNWKRQKTAKDIANETLFTVTQSKLDLDSALYIQCTDTYSIPNDRNSISTLVVKSSHDDGRLANTIAFTLRKLGYPVVNDRFAKRESSALPRRMQNLLKQKVCIGCYQVDIMDAVTQKSNVVSVPPHSRTQCQHWRYQLEPGRRKDSVNIDLN